jgi:predicted nucleic acid-binding protein
VAVLYFDSSGIVKRYAHEIGTTWVSSLLHPSAGNQVYLASIAGAEVVSALVRRGRAAGLAPAVTLAALSQFRHEFAVLFQTVPVDMPLIHHAMTLAEIHALRGYDAVQLAAGMAAQMRTLGSGLLFLFISADAALNAAALAEGLAVDDPNLHP